MDKGMERQDGDNSGVFGGGFHCSACRLILSGLSPSRPCYPLNGTPQAPHPKSKFLAAYWFLSLAWLRECAVQGIVAHLGGQGSASAAGDAFKAD